MSMETILCTTECNLRLQQWCHSPIGSSGWKATSLTEPAWPGSLYRILRDVVSQIYTNLKTQTWNGENDSWRTADRSTGRDFSVGNVAELR